MKHTSQLWFGLALSICFICTSLWAIGPEEESDRSSAGNSLRTFDQSSNGDRSLSCEPVEPIRMLNLPLPVPSLKRAKC